MKWNYYIFFKTILLSDLKNFYNRCAASFYSDYKYFALLLAYSIESIEVTQFKKHVLIAIKKATIEYAKIFK